MPMTGAKKAELLNHLFRGVTMSKPTALYAALEATSGTSTVAGTELSGSGYARAQRDPADANWELYDSNDGIQLTAQLDFPAATGNWTQAVAASLWDASTSGTRWFYGNLTTPVTVLSGTSAPNFPANAIKYNLGTGEFSDYTIQQILNYLFRTSSSLVQPTTLYAGLFAGSLTQAGTGGTEVAVGTYPEYERAVVNCNTTVWTAPTAASPSISNATSFVFPKATTGGWGTIDSIGFYSAPTGGNLIAFTDLDSPVTISLNDQKEFATGSITISI